jgi:cell division septation protein DedD
VGGAAVNGAVGAVTGAAQGVKRGVSAGSHSTPAAALALGALGVAGLVEWPVLLAVGGGALLLSKMNRKPEPPTPVAKATLKPVPSEPEPKKAAPAKAASKPAAKKTAGRRAGATELRSTN